jgi:hypothetical protein
MPQCTPSGYATVMLNAEKLFENIFSILGKYCKNSKVHKVEQKCAKFSQSAQSCAKVRKDNGGVCG